MKGIFREYERQRERMIAKAKELNPNVEMPLDEHGQEVYVIYRRRGRLKAYSKSGIDCIVARVAKRAGIARTITNHTLRRTGARIAYFAGVMLVEIMEGLGHTSEKETIRYLGLTVNELSRAQAKVHSYLQRIKARMTDEAPVEPSGTARISG
ncbi:MAG: Phage integrase family [Candidatus Methanomethylophilaceae archaeon]|nr:Phage integrase family [Candidatus Methanomethylophilaceae archaeon]MDI3541492.1 Phage integrase family [Candidatus Methanomethylophilaceae archaeon]HIJ00332.1 tyrosine-type recombinase/integrase [Candidatus Methanomethylophilaceae archaeon]